VPYGARTFLEYVFVLAAIRPTAFKRKITALGDDVEMTPAL